jgi:hypothetical protein
MKPLYRKTLLQFLPIVFDLERANQLSLLPDKDLVDLCPLIESYQVTKSRFSALLGLVGKMYSKIQSCWRASERNHKDTKDTKIERSYVS